MTPSRIRLALGAVLLALIFAGPAQADCEWSDRIDKDEAECLEGGWHNQAWPKKDTAWARNLCEEVGSVTVKVDRKDAADWTLTLLSDFRKTWSGTAGDVRGIYCCSDRGLCNKSDIINPQGCLDQYVQSPAASSSDAYCYGLSTEGDPDAGTCTISGTCVVNHGANQGRTYAASITASFADTAKIRVCEGWFCL